MKLIIATHGKLGQELVNSAGMVFGQLDNVSTVSLMPGMSFEDFKAEAEAALSAAEGEETLVLVDLFGGTPSNVFSALTRTYNCEVVTGANLPMLIEVYTRTSMADGSVSAKELAEAAVEVAKESAVHTNALLG